MTRNKPLSPARIRPIDRLAGVAPQFFQDGDRYLYRLDGSGPSIPATTAERDQLVRDGRRSLLLHLAALALGIWAATLLAARLHPEGDVVRTAIGTLIASCIGLLLYRSHIWAIHAPARALAGRMPVGPADQVDVTRWPSYRAIFGGTLVVIVAAAMHSHTTLREAVAFAIVGISVGLVIAVLKWRFERKFTPAQRRDAAERRKTVRAQNRAQFSLRKLLLLLMFMAVEAVVMLSVFIVIMGISLEIAGSPWNDPAPGPFLIGFFVAIVAIVFALWPIESLCRRWIGTTPMDELSWLPA
ncbi:hypothetical protein BH11PSE6_BH11PSE6_28530 [soil metagenome]